MLSGVDSELRDLHKGLPEVIEAMSGRPTGLRLVSFVGCGGMSTVFRAELDQTVRSADLSPMTPEHLAIKFLQPSTWRQFQRLNQDPTHIFLREVVALSRIMQRQPPTEFVVGFYGSGYADIDVGGAQMRLPWLALEYVEGGPQGLSLADRVIRAQPGGIDPIRALRLLRGIFSGVAALHEEGIVHRDLKPENVLVSGPIDDETPKLVDCGIARVDGLLATVAGMTPSYGAPEQLLSTQGSRNPLVGAWSDIHALAAVTWFVLAGEDWCRSETDPAWHGGQRRSLRTASSVHSGIVGQPELLAALDRVLSRGAAPRLPDSVWASEAASDYLWSAKKVVPAMWSGVERYIDVETFGAELFPVLEEIASSWSSRAGKENRAATAFRATQPLGPVQSVEIGEQAVIKVIPAPLRESGTGAGTAVFQPDGRYLMRFGSRLEYFIDDKPHKVSVPAEFAPDVRAARWLVRGPSGGFAFAGSSSVLLVRAGRFVRLPGPVRSSGAEVGEIGCVVNDGRAFGVVTLETDDGDGGPELWRCTNGISWEEPIVLPLGGEVSCVAYGPYGFVVVGARKTRGRALFLGFDNQPVVFTKGVNDRPPLVTAVCSAGRESWAAGEGFVLYLERGDVHEETISMPDVPVAMALDPVGSPWLLSERGVYRRHVGSREAKWRLYHRRDAKDLPFVAIGFTTAGVRVVDAHGGGVHLTPKDSALWRPTLIAE